MMFAPTFIVLATGLATLVSAAPADVKVRIIHPFIMSVLGLTKAMLT
jgi:hypothetical protein